MSGIDQFCVEDLMAGDAGIRAIVKNGEIAQTIQTLLRTGEVRSRVGANPIRSRPVTRLTRHGLRSNTYTLGQQIDGQPLPWRMAASATSVLRDIADLQHLADAF